MTTTADSGPGSLRQALLDAAAAPGADEVVVQPGLGTITLSGPLEWTDASSGANPVTIRGNGVRVDFNGAPRGFVDNRGRGVTIEQVEISGVGGTIDDDAAPVVSQGGDVTLTLCVVMGNVVNSSIGDVAGAVLSKGGSATVTSSTIEGNSGSGNADAGGGVLSEGGSITVTDSLIEGNIALGDGNAGGGLESEGGGVTVSGTTVNCNQATAGCGQDTAGGLLSEGGSVTVTDSTFLGNRASAPGSGTTANGILSQGPAPVLTNTTVSDDLGACGGPAMESYFLPKKVTAKANARDPARSKLVAAGILDLGPDPADLASAASLDVGGFHFEAPSLAPAGKAFVLTSGGTMLRITPNPFGSSRAKFRLQTAGDLTGTVALDARSISTSRTRTRRASQG